MIPHIETTIVYNYFVENWENAIAPTKNISKHISNDIDNFYEAHKNAEADFDTPFDIYTAADDLKYSKGSSIATFFIWAFLSFIFFIGAASVLYFRMYNDLTNEKQKYITITKLGLTESEMFRSATIQLGILFSSLTLLLVFIHYLRLSFYKACSLFFTKRAINCTHFLWDYRDYFLLLNPISVH